MTNIFMDKIDKLNNIDPHKIEDLVISDLKKRGILKEYPDLKVKYIWDWIVWTYRKWNLKIYDFYINWKIEVLFNIKSVRENPLFNQSLYVLWYREIKSADWVYEMYNLKDIDNKTWKPLKWAKKLDIYSIDYFKLFWNVRYVSDRIFLESLKLKWEEWKFLNINKWELDGFVRDKTLRIKDVVEYYKNWQIKDQNEYIRYIKLTQNILLEQIWDERAIKYWDPVTLKEINLYKKYNLIPEELYNQAKKKLEEVEKIKQKREKWKKEIHSQTHYWVENEVMVG